MSVQAVMELGKSGEN